MSEADGLRRLTEYLNQTRKQAEVAVDCLNVRIRELEQEREKYLGERDYYKNYAEQLRVENSKKWRLQERDDWKALVDSVQKDRSRLQDDCHKLEEELNMAYDELNRLEDERDTMKMALQESSKGVQKEVQDCTGDVDVEGHQQGEQNQDNSDDHPHGHHEDMLEYETEHECTTPVPDDHSSSKEHNIQDEHQADSRRSSHPCSPNERGTFPNLSIDLPGSSEKEKISDSTGISRTSSTTSSRAGSPRAGQKVSSSKTSPRCTATSPNPSRRHSVIGDREQEPTTPSQSPTPNDGSPRAIVRELRKELSKAHAEIDILRKTSATESLAQEQEISRLREEVRMLRQREQVTGRVSSGGSAPVSGEGRDVAGGQRSTDYSYGETSYPPAIPQPPPHITASQTSISIWSPFSVLGYFFSYSNGASPLSSSHSTESRRTSAQYV